MKFVNWQNKSMDRNQDDDSLLWSDRGRLTKWGHVGTSTVVGKSISSFGWWIVLMFSTVKYYKREHLNYVHFIVYKL